jgi:hypothetical protein
MSPNNQNPDDYPVRPDERQSQQIEIWRGVGLAFLLHLIQIPLTFATAFFSLIFVGISQLLYIIPAIAIYQGKGRPGVVKGLIIAAAVTFLLNATCAVIVFTYMSNHH